MFPCVTKILTVSLNQILIDGLAIYLRLFLLLRSLNCWVFIASEYDLRQLLHIFFTLYYFGLLFMKNCAIIHYQVSVLRLPFCGLSIGFAFGSCAIFSLCQSLKLLVENWPSRELFSRLCSKKAAYYSRFFQYTHQSSGMALTACPCQPGKEKDFDSCKELVNPLQMKLI